MIELFAVYLDRFEELHRDMNSTVADLPVEALNWSPGREMNSLAVLATHTAGAERYWIGDVVARDDSQRDRAAEFRAQAVSALALLDQLDAALAHSRSVLERLSLADLDEQRLVSRDGREVTVAWALAHALEHTATHLGHMQLTRQWWERRQLDRSL
jgi:uncharacterized damage-inducible protein DinB